MWKLTVIAVLALSALIGGCAQPGAPFKPTTETWTQTNYPPEYLGQPRLHVIHVELPQAEKPVKVFPGTM